MKRISYYRIIACLLVLPVIALMLFSYTSRKMLDDVWKQLGITERDGKYNIGTSFTEGYPYFHYARNAQKIALGDRAGVAKGILEYAKQHVSSAAYEKEYMQFREGKKPRTPGPVPTKEQIREKEIKSAEDAMKNLEAGVKNTTDADTKKTFENMIADYKKKLVAYKDPNNADINRYYESAKFQYNSEKAEYDKELTKWEAEFPSGVKLLVKKRLQEFLDATQGVDYNAALKEGKYGKKIFANPVYEKKNFKWKMAFRAGKEVTETARAFAQQWMKEIQ